MHKFNDNILKDTIYILKCQYIFYYISVFLEICMLTIFILYYSIWDSSFG